MNTNSNPNNLRDELNDVKQHAREAARATLLAMRTGIDAALGFLDERAAASQPGASQPASADDATATSTTANDAQPEGSIVPPSMLDDKPPGGANV